MRQLPNFVLLFLVVGLSCGVQTADAQEGAAVPAAPTTIWNRLGFPEGMRKLRGNLTNRRGNNPQREPKVALKALNNPANLAEDMPKVVQEAAKVKIQEDLAPQKIKAIKYLTQIGCACYDKTGEITKALIASSEDCTEEVRLVTMESIHAAAQGKCCANCGMKCCCKPELTMQLSKIVYDRDDTGCYIEPSKRVREAALRALCACCPNAEPVQEEEPEPLPARNKGDGGGERVDPDGEEGDGGEKIEDDMESSSDDEPMEANDDTSPMEEPEDTEAPAEADPSGDTVPAEEDKEPATILPVPREARDTTQPTQDTRLVARVGSDDASTENTQYGVVVQVDAGLRIAHIHFFDVTSPVPNGTQLMAIVERGNEKYWVGPFQVYQSFNDSANVTAASSVDFSQLAVGAQVVATLQLNQPAPARQVSREVAPVVPAHRPVAPVVNRVVPASSNALIDRDVRFGDELSARRTARK